MLTQVHVTAPPVRHPVADAGPVPNPLPRLLAGEDLFIELNRLDAPPPILGFGISTPDHVRQAIAAGAAGAISGSAIVRLVAETGALPDRVASFIAAMNDATRSMK